MREKLGLLISGGGTTMQEMIKACQSNEVQMDVGCIIASTPKAGGIEKAQRLGISEKNIVVVNPKNFRNGNGEIDEDAFGKALLKVLKPRGVTVVTQNGWLPLTPENVIDEYWDAIYNQHPGPVPEFGGEGMYGRRVHAAVLLFTRMTRREPWTEAIAQRVDTEYDEGVVVKSERVPIHAVDTVDDLQQRVLPIEHRVQIELLKDIAKGNISEIYDREKIVRTGQSEKLLFAKKAAKLLYPRG